MRVALLLLLCVCGCTPRWEDGYVTEYQYLRALREPSTAWTGMDEFFLVVLVDARHLDYRSPEQCFLSMRLGLFSQQEPTIGHAWIVLGAPQGIIECGHTGERGVTAPRYFDEICARSARGESNPIAYLFSSLPDGYAQRGSGGHVPTVAAAFRLTAAGYERVRSLISEYDFSEWNIQTHQCVHFVQTCLAAIGVPVSCARQMRVPPYIRWNGTCLHMWSDPKYATITCAPPEELEKQLLSCIQKKGAQDARRWYRHYSGEKNG